MSNWYEDIFEKEIKERTKELLEPMNIRYASSKQEERIRAYAKSIGTANLNDLKYGMFRLELSYYDILKMSYE